MVAYLLDTNVVSEQTKKQPNQSAVNWLSSIPPEDLYLSIISIGEIYRGIEMLRSVDDDKALWLKTWLDHLIGFYRDRVLPLSLDTAYAWGRLTAKHPDHYHDAFIAATAIANNLTVATRNTKHFKDFDVPITNPWELSNNSISDTD